MDSSNSGGYLTAFHNNQVIVHDSTQSIDIIHNTSADKYQIPDIQKQVKFQGTLAEMCYQANTTTDFNLSHYQGLQGHSDWVEEWLSMDLTKTTHLYIIICNLLWPGKTIKYLHGWNLNHNPVVPWNFITLSIHHNTITIFIQSSRTHHWDHTSSPGTS